MYIHMYVYIYIYIYIYILHICMYTHARRPGSRPERGANVKTGRARLGRRW